MVLLSITFPRVLHLARDAADPTDLNHRAATQVAAAPPGRSPR
jgi:hypothetical protein